MPNLNSESLPDTRSESNATSPRGGQDQSDASMSAIELEGLNLVEVRPLRDPYRRIV